MRYLGWILLLAPPLLAQESGGAPGAAPAAADPARLFPAETFAYAEVDASALDECLPQWQIAKILADPGLRALFAPAFGKLGVDPEKPAESLMKHAPLKEILEGRAAVGVRGMSIVVHDAQRRDWKFRVSPEHPADARQMFRMIGLLVALDGPAGQKMTFDYDIDFLAVGRPGTLGKAWVAQALEEMGGEIERETVKIGGLDVTHLVVTTPIFGGLSFAYNFYAVERDGTWFLASHRDTLEQALGGGPRASLASSPSLAQTRARFTGGRPFLLAHVDLGLLLQGYKGFLPKIGEDMADIAGISSIRGLGLGLSLVDGGLRESVGIVLDGNPRGMWKILDGLPTGIRVLEDAPPGALAAFAVKLDLKALRERLLAFVGEVMPGNEEQMDRELVRGLSPPGLDLLKDVIPALGDEMSVVVYPPRGAGFPDFVVRAAARDEEAFGRLAAAVLATVPDDVARFQVVDLAAGFRATRVTPVAFFAPYDLHFAVHKGQFIFASSPSLLGEVAAKWGAQGAKMLVRDDAVLPGVLKSLNGGDAKSLAALGYVNLRGCGLEAIKMQGMWAPFLPQDWFDLREARELRRIPDHLTGIAVALRHDKDGVVLDSFSPTGVLVPAIVAGIMFARAEVVQRAVIQQRQGTGRSSLGITTKTSDGTGVKVLQLFAQGAAAGGGLQQGDKIIAINGVAIATMEDLDRELAKSKPGEMARLKIRRGDEEKILPVELGEEEETGW